MNYIKTILKVNVYDIYLSKHSIILSDTARAGLEITNILQCSNAILQNTYTNNYTVPILIRNSSSKD